MYIPPLYVNSVTGPERDYDVSSYVLDQLRVVINGAQTTATRAHSHIADS